MLRGSNTILKMRAFQTPMLLNVESANSGHMNEETKPIGIAGEHVCRSECFANERFGSDGCN